MTIAIAFICDEGYVMPTGVAIQSLITNAPDDKNTDYDIYILGVDITEKSKNILTSMSRERFIIQVVECSLSDKQKQISNYGSHVTPTAVMRFDLPKILLHYDKVLYLDSDILVTGSLVELFNTDISDVYAGVVRDYYVSKKLNHLEFLDFKQEYYFNSGVMLMNLKKMREDNIPDKLLDYRIHGKNYYMDQDALNVVLHGNVKYISPYYNALTILFEQISIEKLSEFFQIQFPKNKEKIYLNATILHFADRKKPWIIDMNYLTGLYYMYYKMSPFADSKVMHIRYKLSDKPKHLWKKVKRVIGRSKMKKREYIKLLACLFRGKI